MISAVHLGDARSDIVSALAIVMGASKAEAWMRSLEQKIREEAGKGAEAKIKPWLIGALALGGVGAFFGTLALLRRR